EQGRGSAARYLPAQGRGTSFPGSLRLRDQPPLRPLHAPQDLGGVLGVFGVGPPPLSASASLAPGAGQLRSSSENRGPRVGAGSRGPFLLDADAGFLAQSYRVPLYGAEEVRLSNVRLPQPRRTTGSHRRLSELAQRPV